MDQKDLDLEVSSKLTMENTTSLIYMKYETELIDTVLNKSYSGKTLTIKLFMILIMIIGSIGNLVVLIVYYMKTKKSMANYFMWILSGVDFVSCVILHPYVIAKIYWKFTQNALLCKIFDFMIHWNLGLQVNLLVSISIDRYYAVCHPLKFAGAWKRMVILLTVTVIMATIFSIPILEFYGIRTVPFRVDNVLYEAHLCHYNDAYDGSNSQSIFNVCMIIMYVIILTVISTMYAKVAKAAYNSGKQVAPSRNLSTATGTSSSSKKINGTLVEILSKSNKISTESVGNQKGKSDTAISDEMKEYVSECVENEGQVAVSSACNQISSVEAHASSTLSDRDQQSISEIVISGKVKKGMAECIKSDDGDEDTTENDSIKAIATDKTEPYADGKSVRKSSADTRIELIQLKRLPLRHDKMYLEPLKDKKMKNKNKSLLSKRKGQNAAFRSFDKEFIDVSQSDRSDDVSGKQFDQMYPNVKQKVLKTNIFLDQDLGENHQVKAIIGIRAPLLKIKGVKTEECISSTSTAIGANPAGEVFQQKDEIAENVEKEKRPAFPSDRKYVGGNQINDKLFENQVAESHLKDIVNKEHVFKESNRIKAIGGTPVTEIKCANAYECIPSASTGIDSNPSIEVFHEVDEIPEKVDPESKPAYHSARKYVDGNQKNAPELTKQVAEPAQKGRVEKENILDVGENMSSSSRKCAVPSSGLKTAKLLFLVTAAFMLSWSPFWIMRLWLIVNPAFLHRNSHTDKIIIDFFDHLFYLNNAINPILYSLIHKAFVVDCKNCYKKLRSNIRKFSCRT